MLGGLCLETGGQGSTRFGIWRTDSQRRTGGEAERGTGREEAEGELG